MAKVTSVITATWLKAGERLSRNAYAFPASAAVAAATMTSCTRPPHGSKAASNTTNGMKSSGADRASRLSVSMTAITTIVAICTQTPTGMA